MEWLVEDNEEAPAQPVSENEAQDSAQEDSDENDGNIRQIRKAHRAAMAQNIPHVVSDDGEAKKKTN